MDRKELTKGLLILKRLDQVQENLSVAIAIPGVRQPKDFAALGDNISQCIAFYVESFVAELAKADALLIERLSCLNTGKLLSSLHRFDKMSKVEIGEFALNIADARTILYIEREINAYEDMLKYPKEDKTDDTTEQGLGDDA